MRDRLLLIAPAIVTAIGAAIGVGLRCWHVAAEPLWLDEAYSAFAADHDLRFLWTIVPRYETHPPFYYTLLHLWVGLSGDGLLALRLPGLLASFATLAVMALLAEEAGRWLGLEERARRMLALCSIVLASLSLALVEMARQVRPYPLMILVYAAAILLLVRLARRQQEGRPVAGMALAGYLLALELLLWLHALGALYGLALTVALGIALVRPGLQRRDLFWLIAGHVAVALLYLPALAILRGEAAAWTTSTWLRVALDRMLLDRVMTLYGVPGWIGFATPLLTGFAIVALRPLVNGARLAAMLLTLALLPVCLAILLSLTATPVFVTRIMTATAIPALLLLAIGAAIGRYRRVGIAAAALLAVQLLADDVQARRNGPMQDWYGAVAWLQQRFRPGDQVFAYPNEGKLPLAFALRDRSLAVPIRAIPADVPSFEVGNGTHPTGTPGVSALSPDALRAIAAEPATRAVPTIWLLRLSRETFDPDDAFLLALRRDRSIIRTWRHGAIDLVGLRLRSPPAPARNRR